MKTAYFNRFEITLSDACIADCSHQGDCGEDVEGWTSRLNLDLDPKILREELAGYGAWDDEELLDHSENIRRIIWIAAGNIKDEEYEATKTPATKG